MTTAADVVWYKRTADQQLFGVGPLFVTRWSNDVDLYMLRDQNDAQLAHIAKLAGRVPILAVIEHTGMPAIDKLNDEFRTAAREMAKHNEENVLCISYVIVAGGFVGSIVRSVVAGINMVMRSPYSTHVSSSLEEALAWLAPHLDEAGLAYDRAQLDDALREAATHG